MLQCELSNAFDHREQSVPPTGTEMLVQTEFRKQFFNIKLQNFFRGFRGKSGKHDHDQAIQLVVEGSTSRCRVPWWSSRVGPFLTLE